MEFKLIERNKNISNEDLLADIKAVSKKLLVTSLSREEYDNNGKYNSSTICRHFGGWNKALELAGIDFRNKQYTEYELFENLEKVWITKCKQPARRDMDNKNISHISSGAYLRRYGQWNNALKKFIEYIELDNPRIESDLEVKKTDKHKTKRDINLKMRFKVFQRDNFKCCACGASPAKDSTVELHVDHIIPWAKGGETVIDNLQTLCSKCNWGKSDME